jgi:transporter family protein
MWLFFALLSAIFAAAMSVLAKAGLKNLDSTLVTTVRGMVMVGFLIIISLVLKKFQGFSLHSFSGREWLFVVLSGIAGALSWLCYFFALKYGLVSKVSAIDRTSLIFSIILAAIFLGEAIGWKVVLGAVLMIGGAILISL